MTEHTQPERPNLEELIERANRYQWYEYESMVEAAEYAIALEARLAALEAIEAAAQTWRSERASWLRLLQGAAVAPSAAGLRDTQAALEAALDALEATDG